MRITTEITITIEHPDGSSIKMTDRARTTVVKDDGTLSEEAEVAAAVARHAADVVENLGE